MSTDSSINDILSFWFDPRFPYTRWFIPNPTLDAEIATKFTHLITLARTTPTLDTWTSTPRGCLALILLLDQFPRNIFRNSPDAYSSDQKALSIATRAVAQRFDRQITAVVQQAFLYLPFEHQEDLVSQVACVGLFEGLAERSKGGEEQEKGFVEKSVDYAVRHRQVVLDFGRFPARNEVLGRPSTEEEREFLKTHPQGF